MKSQNLNKNNRRQKQFTLKHTTTRTFAGKKKPYSKTKKLSKFFKWETLGQSNFTTDIEPRRSWWSETQTVLTCTRHWPVCDSAKLMNSHYVASRRVVVRWSDTLFESRFFPLVRFRLTVTRNFFNLDSRFAGRRLRPVYMEVGVPRFKWGDPLR